MTNVSCHRSTIYTTPMNVKGTTPVISPIEAIYSQFEIPQSSSCKYLIYKMTSSIFSVLVTLCCFLPLFDDFSESGSKFHNSLITEFNRLRDCDALRL